MMMMMMMMLPFLFLTLLCCESSIYEALKSNGLPMGLLPKGVKGFSIDGEGRFEAHLDQACSAKFESELHYERNVSGRLSYGHIGELAGVSAQELFLWFPVKSIRVDVPSSGVIYFDVGVVFKQFSLSLFETPRDCTAVRSGYGGGGAEDGEFVPEALLKVHQSGKLQFRLDMGDSPRNVL